MMCANWKQSDKPPLSRSWLGTCLELVPAESVTIECVQYMEISQDWILGQIIVTFLAQLMNGPYLLYQRLPAAMHTLHYTVTAVESGEVFVENLKQDTGQNRTAGYWLK